MDSNQSVKRGLQILEYLADASKPRSLSVVSKALGLNKSTVYRFLSTLEENGYVYQETESGYYSLTMKLAWLAGKLIANQDVRSVARPYLEELALQTGETVHLGILEQNEVVYVDKVQGNQIVQMRSSIGLRAPLHTTSLGKILLAHAPEQKWLDYVNTNGLPPRTSNSITDENDFLAHLKRIREENFCVDDEENENNIRCVASGVQDHTGTVVASISVSGSTLTMTYNKVDRTKPLIQAAAQTVSKVMGYAEPLPVTKINISP